MTREFTLDGPGVLKAFTVTGDIEVTSVMNSQKVRVELYVDRGYAFWSNSKNIDNYRITMIQKGNEVVASVERKSKETGFFSDQMKFSYKIYVPVSLSTELKTSGGHITIKGLEGDQLAKSNAGNIEIDNVKGSIGAYTSGGNIEVFSSRGTIFAHTSGGNISIDESMGELRLKSQGGRITAGRISGSMVARVQGGDIKAHFVHVGQGISLETSAGDIFLELPQAPGYDLVMRGTDITIPSRMYFEGTRNRQKVEGKLEEGGAPINLTTNAGKIALKING